MTLILQKEGGMRIHHFLSVLVCTVLLLGCTKTVEKVKSTTWAEVAGTLGGAALGGYTGAQLGGGIAQTLFTATGALVGGGTGYNVIRQLGPIDLTLYEKTAQAALTSTKTREIHRWNNPKSGRSGMFRTIQSYQRADGSDCRIYRSSVVFDDGVASTGGSACQQENGRWLALNDNFR